MLKGSGNGMTAVISAVVGVRWLVAPMAVFMLDEVHVSEQLPDRAEVTPRLAAGLTAGSLFRSSESIYSQALSAALWATQLL